MYLDRRAFLECGMKAAGAVTVLSAGTTASSYAVAQYQNGSVDPLSPKPTSTLLFFDDWPLNRRDHVERHVGRPELQQESTFVDPRLNVSWGYPSVFRDVGSGIWRCLYQGWDTDRKRLYPVVAESEDGLRWRTPDVTASVPIKDRVYGNQVLPVGEFSEWNPCYYDAGATASERLKGLVFYHATGKRPLTVLWVSPDGLHWRRIDDVQWQREAPDPVTAAFWNYTRSAYVLTTRPSLNDRRIAVLETRDWRVFSDPELALEADGLDTPLAELYGMPVFPYEGMFVGLLWIFHVSQEVNGESPLKFLGGKLDCQLTYSRNGWHFQRGLRDALIPNSAPGRLGAGCIQPSCMIVDDKETIRIYGSAAAHEHGVPHPSDGAIVLYTLRRDGFVYLQSSGGVGIIGTRTLLCEGGLLELNGVAPSGDIRIQVTDSGGAIIGGYSFAECVPFAGDDLRWKPHWTNGRSMANLAGQVIRLEVLLDNARLYAIRGNFRMLTAPQTYEFEQRKQTPSTSQEKRQP